MTDPSDGLLKMLSSASVEVSSHGHQLAELKDQFAPGTEVTLVDVNPARAELAQALGVSFAGPERAKGDRDLVVHASGNGSGLGTALALAGEEATVLEMSWYGDAPVTAPLGGIWGERDATAYPYVEERRDLLRAIRPNAPFDIIAGAGHWVMYEAAQAFNRALIAQLAATERAEAMRA